MRPAPSLSRAALTLAVGAGVLAPLAAHAQDRSRDDATRERRRIERELVVERDGGGVRVFRRGGDPNRAMLDVVLDRGDERGVRVADVNPDGPAGKAGLEEGDRIVSIDGTDVTIPKQDADDPELADLGARRLQRAMARVKPGDEVTLVILRDGTRRTLRVKTVSETERADRRRGVTVFGPEGTRVWRGFDGDSGFLRTLPVEIRAMRDSARARAERRPALGLSVQTTGSARDTLGLFVGAITSGGPAEKAGIVEGERIAAINGVDVRVPREDMGDADAARARVNRFMRELQKARPGDDVTLRLWEGGRTRTVTVKAGRAADVFRDEGFGFSFGEMPFAPMAPRPPRAPLAPGRVEIRALPRLRTPVPPAAPGAPAAPRVIIRRTADA